MGNIYVEQTLEGLDINNDDKRIAQRGFGYDVCENDEDCVLILGLNPAGDAEDEKNRDIYFYSTSFDVKGGAQKWIYNKYYRPIQTTVSEIVGEDAKWTWCNKEWSDIEKYIDDNPGLSEYKNKLHKEYEKYRDSAVTIYIGDLFYYHETNSKKLP